MTRLARLARTTAVKLATFYLVLTALIAAAMIAVIVHQTSRILQDQIDAALEVEIAALEGVYREGGLGELVRTVERRSNQPGSNLYLVTTPLGQPVAGNIATIEPGALDRAETREIVYAREDDTRSRTAVARIFLLPGGFRLLVGRDLAEQVRFRAVVWQAATLGAAAVLLLGLGGGWWAASRVARRIDAMTDANRSIMAGDFDRRLPIAGRDDEFDRLAASVNALLDRIQDLMRGLQHVSENIAHDLKTPLTRLRSRAESALRSAASADELRASLQQTLDESEALIRTFDALLTIARTESGAGQEGFARVDLSAVASGVVELYAPLAEERGLVLSLDAPAPVEGRAHRELVAQAVANLVDNAIKHVPADAPPERRTIVVEVRRRGEGADVTVADHGAGIPESERGRVLERFVRLDADPGKPGAGLGLTLVAAIARLHGGTIELADNRPGLRATLALP